MHIHRVNGIRVVSRSLDGLMTHDVTFYSSYSPAAISVVFYTKAGKRLLVDGADKWGNCPEQVTDIVREDIHVMDGKFSVQSTLSKTGNYVQNVYGATSCILSYVTSVPVALALVDDNGGDQ